MAYLAWWEGTELAPIGTFWHEEKTFDSSDRVEIFLLEDISGRKSYRQTHHGCVYIKN